MGLKNDINGLAPFIWIALLLIGATGTYIAVENITQQPTITYNITESPFTFLGGSVNWIWIIVIAVAIIFVLLWIFGKTKKKE